MTISLIDIFRGLYRLCFCGCDGFVKIIDKQGRPRKFKPGHNNMNKPKKYRIKIGNYYFIYKPYFKHARENGYIQEHRYIYYIYLSILNNKPMYIEGLEIHHRDENPENNRIENLQLVTKPEHKSIHNPITDRTNTFCNICKSKTTIKIFKCGTYYDCWYNDIEGWLCHSCYHMIEYYIEKFSDNKYHYIRVNEYNRFCNLCNTNKTAKWYIDINGYLCLNCCRMVRRLRERFGLSVE